MQFDEVHSFRAAPVVLTVVLAPQEDYEVIRCQAESMLLAGAVTVALDLGRFVLDSSPQVLEKLGEEEAAVYLPFELAVRNVSAYVVDGAFDWALLGSRLAPLLQAGGVDSESDSGASAPSSAWLDMPVCPFAEH